MASEKRLIDATPEHIRAVLEKVPYYPDEIWKFTAMTERFPTVDAVEVVHGEWIHHYYDSGEPIDDNWYCSECHMCNGHKRTWYCPNCGAKMDGERKDSENETHFIQH